MTEPGVPLGSVRELWRYPVASLRGERLESTELAEEGVPGDRCRAVRSLETGETGMAARGSRWKHLVMAEARYLGAVRRESELPPVELRFPDGSLTSSDREEANEKLSQLVGHRIGLTLTERAGGRGEERIPTAYAFTPLHLVTTASLDHLQGLYPQGQSDVRRFRPNILIETPDRKGFIEGDWVGRRIALGAAVLSVTEDCKRCAMTTNAQGDLPADPGILHTVTRENRAHLGVYATVLRPGKIALGDRVTLLE
jgi:uncharacterized protein YcbX